MLSPYGDCAIAEGVNRSEYSGRIGDLIRVLTVHMEGSYDSPRPAGKAANALSG